MIEEVAIAKIVPNPFCARDKSSEAMSGEAIGSLAKEIEDLGWWATPLKARRRNGRYELAFGSRRLAALKRLGRETVTLDVDELDDDRMVLLMAAENFQRHGFTDDEKLDAWDAVKKAIGCQASCAHDCGHTAKAAARMGIGPNLATRYNTALKYRAAGERPANLPAGALAKADRIGGRRMVATAARLGLGEGTLSGIATAISKTAAGNERMKVGLVKAAQGGRILHAADVPRIARKLQDRELDRAVKQAKTKAPPDLLKVVRGWVRDLPDIIGKLRAVGSEPAYADYIMEGDPELAREFQKLLGELSVVVSKLERSILPRLCK